MKYQESDYWKRIHKTLTEIHLLFNFTPFAVPIAFLSVSLCNVYHTHNHTQNIFL